jgi:predicted nucleotidyltransferase
MAKAISIDRTSLGALCRRHYIRRLSLFGSVLRPDFRPDSDVDVLVEFEPGQVPGFLALHEIETELSKLLAGRTVDLVTQRSLNRRLRDRVVATASAVLHQISRYLRKTVRLDLPQPSETGVL